METVPASITPPATIPVRAVAQARQWRRQEGGIDDSGYALDWNTCGYYSGISDEPFTCGDPGSCLCQISGERMGTCYSPAPGSSTCYYITACYPSTESEIWELQTNICNDACEESMTYCYDSNSPYCVYHTWLDMGAGAWGCGADDITADILLFSAIADATTDSDSSTTTSTSTSRSSSRSTSTDSRDVEPTATATATAAATKSTSNMAPGVIALISLACVAGISALIGAIVWIMRHRKTVEVNDKRARSFGPNFVVHKVRKTGGPAPFEIPRDAVEKDGNPAQTTSSLADPANKPLPSSRGTSNIASPVASPVPSPSPSPGPPNNAHQSTAISSLNLQDNGRVSTQVSSSSLRGPAYRSFSSEYLHQLPSMSDPPFTQIRSAHDLGPGQSWLSDGRASELQGPDFHNRGRDTAVSELMGSMPQMPKHNSSTE